MTYQDRQLSRDIVSEQRRLASELAGIGLVAYVALACAALALLGVVTLYLMVR